MPPLICPQFNFFMMIRGRVEGVRWVPEAAEHDGMNVTLQARTMGHRYSTE